MKNNLLFFIFTILTCFLSNAQENKISIDNLLEKSSTIKPVDLSKMPAFIILTPEQIKKRTPINRKKQKNNINTYRTPKKALSTLEYNKLNDSINYKTNTSSNNSKN